MTSLKHIRRIVIWLGLSYVLLPALAFAQGAGGLQNPTNFPSIEKFIEGVLKAVVYLAIPVIALFMVYAGFKYVAARGNESKVSEAHKNFLYVVIGAILILGAWVFATLIGGTVSQLVSG